MRHNPGRRTSILFIFLKRFRQNQYYYGWWISYKLWAFANFLHFDFFSSGGNNIVSIIIVSGKKPTRYWFALEYKGPRQTLFHEFFIRWTVALLQGLARQQKYIVRRIISELALPGFTVLESNWWQFNIQLHLRSNLTDRPLRNSSLARVIWSDLFEVNQHALVFKFLTSLSISI